MNLFEIVKVSLEQPHGAHTTAGAELPEFSSKQRRCKGAGLSENHLEKPQPLPPPLQGRLGWACGQRAELAGPAGVTELERLLGLAGEVGGTCVQVSLPPLPAPGSSSATHRLRLPRQDLVFLLQPGSFEL